MHSHIANDQQRINPWSNRYIKYISLDRISHHDTRRNFLILFINSVNNSMLMIIPSVKPMPASKHWLLIKKPSDQITPCVIMIHIACRRTPNPNLLFIHHHMNSDIMIHPPPMLLHQCPRVQLHTILIQIPTHIHPPRGGSMRTRSLRRISRFRRINHRTWNPSVPRSHHAPYPFMTILKRHVPLSHFHTQSISVLPPIQC
mmetsp:Transcript_8521/g.12900  ORF Transcript_8521/g.12900 Transcript_8521/m.12900 type:complete len:201 (-) Transcript_8521:436-1038(-)